jgi:hypothetical protein
MKIIPVLLAVFMFSCTATKEKKPVDAEVENPIPADDNLDSKPLPKSVSMLKIGAEYQIPTNQKMFGFSDPYLNGDTLVVNINYTGGCATHEFVLHLENQPQKPIESCELALHHNPVKDDCKAIVNQEYKFVLTRLSEFAGQNKTIQLTLGDHNLIYGF